MHGWMNCVRRLYEATVDPFCAAAIAGIGFFSSIRLLMGTGAATGFLFHHMLAQLGFSPPGVLFPISAVTDYLYRYWDATNFAEYLFDVAGETIRSDFRDEIEFLTRFDAAVNSLREIVDMPDRRASLLVRLILQNNGRLSR
jgi:hypothetical protein